MALNKEEIIHNIISFLSESKSKLWFDSIRTEEYIKPFNQRLHSDWIQIMKGSNGLIHVKVQTLIALPIHKKGSSVESSTCSPISEKTITPLVESPSEPQKLPKSISLPDSQIWNLIITKVVNFCQVYIRLIQYEDDLTKLIHQMHTYYEPNPKPVNDVIESKVCAYKLKDTTFRVSAQSRNNTIVRYISQDNGKQLEVNQNQLHKMLNRFLVLSFQSLKCSLHGLELYEDNRVASVQLEELISALEKPILVRVPLSRSDPISISLFDTSVEDSAIHCGFPGRPAYGRALQVADSYSEGQAVTYTCDNGYYMVGPVIRRCLPNGTWTANMPVCDTTLSPVGYTSSSEALSLYPPELAVDSNKRSCFYSNRRKPRWWRMDMGLVQTVISVSITVPFANETEDKIRKAALIAAELAVINEKKQNQLQNSNPLAKSDTQSPIGLYARVDLIQKHKDRLMRERVKQNQQLIDDNNRLRKSLSSPGPIYSSPTNYESIRVSSLDLSQPYLLRDNMIFVGHPDVNTYDTIKTCVTQNNDNSTEKQVYYIR